MASESIFTGKSVDEAIEEGLRALGITADRADIEIIHRGSRGIFGLGSEPAQVRITPRAADIFAGKGGEAGVEESVAQASAAEVLPTPQQARVAIESDDDEAESETNEKFSPEEEAQLSAMATEMLGQMVQLMGFEADILADWRDPDADNEHRYLLLDLQGSELGALIGRRGDTLNNIQYLIRLMVNQRVHKWKNIVVDVEGYRQRRIDHLSQLAQRSAGQVAQSGRPLSLEPMPANERRIIHLTLRNNPDVYTESIGEGGKRKIQILPRRS